MLDWFNVAAGSSATNPIVVLDYDGDSAHPIVISDDGDDPSLASPSWPSSVQRLEGNEKNNHIVFADDYAGNCFCSESCVRGMCVNASSTMCCESTTCRAGDLCGNRLHESKSLILMRSSKGYCVSTSTAIPKGVVLGEYCGRIVTASELTPQLIDSGFVLQFKSKTIEGEHVFVDASRSGGIARFINHSCAPNCRFEERSHRTARKMAIVTHSAIRPGEEVTVKYNKKVTFQCLCGEACCVSRVHH